MNTVLKFKNWFWFKAIWNMFLCTWASKMGYFCGFSCFRSHEPKNPSRVAMHPRHPNHPLDLFRCINVQYSIYMHADIVYAEVDTVSVIALQRQRYVKILRYRITLCLEQLSLLKVIVPSIYDPLSLLLVIALTLQTSVIASIRYHLRGKQLLNVNIIQSVFASLFLSFVRKVHSRIRKRFLQCVETKILVSAIIQERRAL